MILEASGCVGRRNPAWDVCIVGSGPAGASLALGLRGTPLRVVVLESGGWQVGAETDELRAVEHSAEGIRIKPYSRERVVGGASTTWAGLTTPLDPVDFQVRPWVPFSGWPFDRESLVPWYREAARRFGLPDWERFEGPEGLGIPRSGRQVPAWRDLDEKVFLAPAQPPRFGREFREAYQGTSPDLLTDCTVTHLEGVRESGRVTKAMARLMDGRELAIPARMFVLAGGGIENPRILLNSTFACPDGLGNDRDQVGRCFMNHPKNDWGWIEPAQPDGDLPAYFGFLSVATGLAGYLGLRLSEERQARDGLLNSYVRLEPVFRWSGVEGVEALVWLLKRSGPLQRLFLKSRRGRTVPLRDYAETGDSSDRMSGRKTPGEWARMLKAIASDFPDVARYLLHRVRDGVAVPVARYRIRNFMEMAPDPSNRVTLGTGRDRWGMRLPRVCHIPGDLDRRSMAAVHRVLAEEAAAAGWGRLREPLMPDQHPWPIDFDASHHLGGTRMGSDPATSVVDADGRVHGCPNVYVAGSSTFPTSGNANPTYTILALSLRLADHLTRIGAAR